MPFKKNTDLDYEFIAQKCDKVVEGIIDFDNDVHQMDSQETKDLFYFFKYVKKNLFLIAAMDRQFAFYEDEMKEQFVKFHTQVQDCARRPDNFCNMHTLVNMLTLKMAESIRQINPPCKEEIDLRMIPEEMEDIESTSLALQSGILTEIELQNVNKYAQKQVTAVRQHAVSQLMRFLYNLEFLGFSKHGVQMTWYLIVVMMMFFITFLAHHYLNLNFSWLVKGGNSGMIQQTQLNSIR